MLNEATPREQLAAMAMQGILASGADYYPRDLAELAFQIADAMIAENRKQRDADTTGAGT